MIKNGIIVYLLVGCYSIGVSQEELSVYAPTRRSMSFLRYGVDYKKALEDSVVLTKRSRQILSIEESEKAKTIDSLVRKIESGTLRMSILDKKGRLIEICSGNREFLIGGYELYWKNGFLRINGSFNIEGGREGEWIYYNRKGNEKKRFLYENGLLLK